jgi:exosortase
MTHPARRAASPRFATLTVALCILALCTAFRHDIRAGLDVACRGATYAYCLLIPFISLGIVVGRRRHLAGMAPCPSPWGVVVGGAAAIAWWCGELAAINELKQLAIVAMAQGVLLALLGWRFYRVLWFPFLYLFLMVPVGSVLVRPLQAITTGLAAALLRLSAVPVAVHGTVIEVPVRAYEVEPGCAGLNYLLVTLAVASLYVWSLYGGAGKRLAGVAVALAVAVLANAVRVYGIIALAEFTGQRIDLGPRDHLLHGWVFFSVLMVAMMAFGRRFEDRRAPVPPPPLLPGGPPPSPARLAAIGALALMPAVAARLLG